MSGWTAKRFWKVAQVAEADGGFCVRLDDRDIKTPGKSALLMPTRAMAEAVAEEWDAQGDKIDPRSMPVTRSANSAIDKVAPQYADVVAMLADYGGTDLLCYRAETPAELVARQDAAWNPLLDWAADALGAPLRTFPGVVYQPQPEASLKTLHGTVAQLSTFELTAFHDLVAISGSLVLGLAVIRGHLSPDQAWQAARIDEDWQTEQWGVDDEASEMAARKRADIVHAARFYNLSN